MFKGQYLDLDLCKMFFTIEFKKQDFLAPPGLKVKFHSSLKN